MGASNVLNRANTLVNVVYGEELDNDPRSSFANTQSDYTDLGNDYTDLKNCLV